MMESIFEDALLASAEQIDRKLGPARIAQLKYSHGVFRAMGKTDDEIKHIMALTAHEMRLIRQLS